MAPTASAAVPPASRIPDQPQRIPKPHRFRASGHGCLHLWWPVSECHGCMRWLARAAKGKTHDDENGATDRRPVRGGLVGDFCGCCVLEGNRFPGPGKTCSSDVRSEERRVGKE